MHTQAPVGSGEFFADVERQRLEAEPFIAHYADFVGSRGRDVLEIGVGLGTDFVQFARAGARATGVDLTEHSAALVRQRLELERLEGRVLVADAEALPFADNSFDRVYSWGVLHHTPDTQRAAREALRVLRPGGSLCVMLYGRHSWVAYALWAKYALLQGRPWHGLNHVLGRHMESAGTKGYTRREIRSMFAGLVDARVDTVVTVYDRNFAGRLVRLAGERLGWFLVIRGRAPDDPKSRQRVVA